jgi:hypothetical protein
MVYLFTFLLYADPKNQFLNDEMVGGDPISRLRMEPKSQALLRMSKRWNTYISGDTSDIDLKAVSLSYNLSHTFTLGFSQFLNLPSRNGYDRASQSLNNFTQFGISSFTANGQSWVSQGDVVGIPASSKLIYLQFYPFLDKNFPLFFSINGGRIDAGTVITSSDIYLANFLIPNTSASIRSTVNELPSLYYGYTVGYRYLIPDSSFFIGIEFGSGYAEARKFRIYSEYNLDSKSSLGLLELEIYNKQILSVLPLGESIPLNYSLQMGLRF